LWGGSIGLIKRVDRKGSRGVEMEDFEEVGEFGSFKLE
jgi:hypothetical protein